MSAVMGTTVDKIWTKKNGKNTEIGFTQSYLDEIITECWHITPASRTKVREKSPLLTVETNEAQFTIMSPIAGEFLFFNDAAMNFPDKLKDTDVVCILGEREAIPAKKPPMKSSSGDERPPVNRMTPAELFTMMAAQRNFAQTTIPRNWFAEEVATDARQQQEEQ